jgi:hypothetical protein
VSKKSKFLVVQAELLLLTPQDCVRFALFCAEQVRDSWKDIPECVAAINMVERWLKGKAAEEECVNASSAAYDAAYAANAAAAYAAAYAASAAANAANADAAYSDATAAAYAASDAAYAADAAAYVAAYDAAYAANAAAGKSHLIEAQWNYYNELLHFDDIAEKALLGEII